MATMKDCRLFEDAMKESKRDKNCIKWVGSIAVYYETRFGCWIAEYEEDIRIHFTNVTYHESSLGNYIQFTMHGVGCATIRKVGMPSCGYTAKV